MKNRRRVVLVSPDYPPPLSAGSAVYFYNLAENATEPMDILTAPLPAGMQDVSSRRHGVIHSRFLVRGNDATSIRLFLMYLYLFFWALKIGVWRRYELVVFFTSVIGNGFFSVLFRLLRVRIISFILAEEIPMARKAPGLKGMLKRLCIKGYSWANAFISNCDFATAILIRMGIDSNRICMIPSPVAHKKICSDFTKRHLRRNGCYEILTVARLAKHKGVHLIIDALDILRQDIPDIHLTVVGDGTEKCSLMDQVSSKGLERHVTFTGAIFDDEKISLLYNSCDLFVLANIMLENGNCDGTPNVLIEASAHGKPVIAGIEGGTSSAVVDGVTGYLLDPRDISLLSKVMKNLLLDRELAARLGTNGRRKVEEEHNPVKAGLRFSTFLRQVA